MLGVRDVKHGDLSRLIHGYKEAAAIAGNAHQLRPTTGLDRGEVEHRFGSSVASIDEVQMIIEHAGRVGPRRAVMRDEFDVDGTDLAGQFDGPENCLVLEIPHPDAPTEIDSPVH